MTRSGQLLLLPPLLFALLMPAPVRCASVATAERGDMGSGNTAAAAAAEALALASLDARLAAADFAWPGEPKQARALPEDAARGRAGALSLRTAARHWSTLRYDAAPADASWDAFECLCSTVEAEAADQ